MLAFAPMPCVPASLHDMAKMRVGTGQSLEANPTANPIPMGVFKDCVCLVVVWLWDVVG